MSEQSKDKQDLDQNIDLGRRKLAKIGAAAPVIMTLASKPVFGAQCLSQMMSGNASHQEGSCSLGWSPGGWCNEGGQVNGVSTIGAWDAADFDFGENVCIKEHPNNGTCQEYGFEGGSTVLGDTPFLFNSGAKIPPNTSPTDITMRQVICDPKIDQELRHCLAAYLNASLPNFNYVLTQDQVVGLCNGLIPLPAGYSSLNSFLDSTWT